MGEIPQLPAAVPETVRSSRLASPSQAAQPRPAGPAFEALLSRLEARAAELKEKSEALAGPAELPGALDAARASLEEALHLGQELLEAYHAVRRTQEPRS
jgi:predicted RNase H-like HicB family nuclease